MIDNKNLYWDSNMKDYMTDTQSDSSAAKPEDVVYPNGYRDLLNDIHFGMMPNNTGYKYKLKIGESIKIPNGYHDGNGVIETESLADATQGTATEDDIALNKIVWVNGKRIVGKLDLNMMNQVGTATEDDILDGATAWVNGIQIKGKIQKLPRHDVSLVPGESYTFPKGYSLGTSVISVPELSQFTKSDVKPENIEKGYRVCVNGEYITGTFSIQDYISDELGDLSATTKDIKAGTKAITDKGTVIGTMIDHTGYPNATLKCGESLEVEEGYYDGNWKISAASLKDQTYGTASEDTIKDGYTAWVNGKLVTGKMAQYITDATDTTATVFDIKEGKTAYINGKKCIGASLHNLIEYHHEADNKDAPNDIVVNILPRFDWNYVYYIAIELVDTSLLEAVTGKAIVFGYSKHDTYVGDFFKITSEDDDNRIIITPTMTNENTYIRSTIVGYDFEQITPVETEV